ncbi:bifunctional glycosyltransferase/CDP-glycerol:glycerophosphate glycerophosphotransferase [Arthrobacter sp. IK3]|uniref:bifunctional glycosyltransferase/CDP-glycerol:glycerophosphate glycerophosphotransferase n=1 Tax=Arthrobacter sp. IK3 TaxID=3448169 RepID=UPI003EE40273
MPMYNVAPYLERCLASLVSQSYRQLEIILVDDGSTDSTASIAAGYARRDRRIRLVRLPHGGNGHARNEGIKAARGRFIAFADADDVVPAEAYEAMTEALARTGSDFCVGAYGRIRGTKRTPVALSTKLHQRERTGIRISDAPEIIDDVFLWNKMFSREFWNASVGPIPEGIRYEDQETTARAYLRARAFDVLTPVLYWWRIREDGSSLTQSKHLVEDLRDRLTVAEEVTQLFRAEAPETALDHWHERLLGTDLLPYLEQVPDAADEYWELLRTGVRRLMPAGLAGLERTDPQTRVMLYLAAHGRREELAAAVVDRINNGTASPLTFDGNSITARPPFLRLLRSPVPKELLLVNPGVLELECAVDRVEYDGAGRGVRAYGHAYVRNADCRTTQLQLTVGAGNGSGIVPLPVERVHDPNLDLISGDRNCSYADSAFTVDLTGTETAELRIRLETAGHVLEGKARLPGPPATSTGAGVPQVEGAEAAGENLYLDLVQAPAGASFALVTARFRIPAVSTRLPAGMTRLRFELPTERWGRNLPAPPSGAYTLRWRQDGTLPGPGDPAVGVPEAAAGKLPSVLLAGCRIRAFRTPTGSMAVGIGAPLGDDEAGAFNSYRLRRSAFAAERSRELQPGIFFESFAGKGCTDSPRAISDYLAASGFDEPLYWSVADRSVPVPDYAVPLLQGSTEWYERLATTGRLVNNNNFPWFFTKAPGQLYLQTWHGTPLKKIGLDIPQRTLALSYRDLMQREAQWWDLLLAQNSFAAEVLPKALGYSGTVLTAGYPRNDALAAPYGDARHRTRKLLGIGAEQRVLLYAPTWRDAVRDDAGRSDWVGYLDLDQALGLLGPEWTILVRGHHNVAAQRRLNVSARVHDVTDYPEVNDLYLASDVLVTDYSSAIFDYSVLGRPIYFLVPDLAEYKASRGFYLDFEADLPGVAVSGTAELVQAVRTDSGFRISELRDFARRFAPQDTGGAAAAAAQALLEAPADAKQDQYRLKGPNRG